MKLKFRARPGNLVHWPGLKANGQVCHYVGRDFVPGDAGKGFAAAHPASEQPVVVDSDTADGRRLAKLCRRDDALWPADAETAAYCGKTFVPLLRDSNSGEWEPAPAAPQKTGSSARKSGPESE